MDTDVVWDGICADDVAVDFDAGDGVSGSKDVDILGFGMFACSVRREFSKLSLRTSLSGIPSLQCAAPLPLSPVRGTAFSLRGRLATELNL